MKKFLLILAIVALLLGCDNKIPLKLATTTSTENSGLLEYLLPEFETDTKIKVDVIAVGTGKAIKLGENGDVDVILVHARGAENKFVTDGFGVNRRDVMHNDFVIIGVKNDVAKIMKAQNATEALQKIAFAKAEFISRGDDSGTHKKEKNLWKNTGILPTGKWYKEIGQGMGATINMANELAGYTITDRGTYIAMQDKITLKILFDGDVGLLNPYGIIAVNPQKHPNVNYKSAMKFINWLTSEKAQKMINQFQKNGKQLFYADAIK
ncbi:MAG: extracellular solute-binding protein [Candidatus Cloacimonetes bacterium]|nr:extracellular solute-binding protein [Candidatus Cloacimonadota bacterium]MBT6993472.1 extracellular solute-binding protein [Candidatus Cloacimonadota bacterium]MBT7469418.1 extracellular solute-binding protein [Candidatus Cloacimonadota bacterium]